MNKPTQYHIADSLWLCAFADAVEWELIWSDDVNPGFNGEWSDVVPAAPQEAIDAAAGLVAQIGGEKLAEMETRWRRLTGLSSERFGHCVALQSLGHGVGLSDDIPISMGYERPDLPSIEFSIWDMSTLPDGCRWNPAPDFD